MLDMIEEDYQCSSCGANWTKDEYTHDCMECGGGALERSCIICGGRCGSIYKRAVIDSWDTKEAHWIGGCNLPAGEQLKHMKKWIKKNH
jgi:hypothetical protein